MDLIYILVDLQQHRKLKLGRNEFETKMKHCNRVKVAKIFLQVECQYVSTH